VCDVGVQKANLDLPSMLAPAILAGAFIAVGACLSTLSLAGALRNLIPVTLGKLVGGAGLVGSMYWFIYLRAAPATASSVAWEGGTQWHQRHPT
jgi:formate/nitrite transporter FocA (FNT family)